MCRSKVLLFTSAYNLSVVFPCTFPRQNIRSLLQPTTSAYFPLHISKEKYSLLTSAHDLGVFPLTHFQRKIFALNFSPRPRSWVRNLCHSNRFNGLYYFYFFLNILNKIFEKPLKRFYSNLNLYPQLKLWAVVKSI